jgi:hypothetical protein
MLPRRLTGSTTPRSRTPESPEKTRYSALRQINTTNVSRLGPFVLDGKAQ